MSAARFACEAYSHRRTNVVMVLDSIHAFDAVDTFQGCGSWDVPNHLGGCILETRKP